MKFTLNNVAVLCMLGVALGYHDNGGDSHAGNVCDNCYDYQAQLQYCSSWLRTAVDILLFCQGQEDIENCTITIFEYQMTAYNYYEYGDYYYYDDWNRSDTGVAQSYHDEDDRNMSDTDMGDYMSDYHEAVVCENCYEYYDDSNYTPTVYNETYWNGTGCIEEIWDRGGHSLAEVEHMYCEMNCNYTYLDGESCIELYYNGSTCMTRAATDLAYCVILCNSTYLRSSGSHIGFNYTHTSLNQSDCVELSWTGSSCMEIPATDTSYCEMTCNNTYFDYANWECINRTWYRSNSTCQDMAVNETLCYWHHPYYSYIDSNDTDWDWYTWNNFVKRTLNIDSGLVRNCSSEEFEPIDGSQKTACRDKGRVVFDYHYLAALAHNFEPDEICGTYLDDAMKCLTESFSNCSEELIDTVHHHLPVFMQNICSDREIIVDTALDGGLNEFLPIFTEDDYMYFINSIDDTGDCSFKTISLILNGSSVQTFWYHVHMIGMDETCMPGDYAGLNSAADVMFNDLKFEFSKLEECDENMLRAVLLSFSLILPPVDIFFDLDTFIVEASMAVDLYDQARVGISMFGCSHTIYSRLESGSDPQTCSATGAVTLFLNRFCTLTGRTERPEPTSNCALLKEVTFTCVSDTGNEFEYYASVESGNNIEATFRSNAVSAVLTEGPLSDGTRYVAVNYAGVTLVVMRTGGALFITMRIAVSVAAISSGPLANGCEKPNEIGDERKKRDLGTLVNAEALCGHLTEFNYTSCVYDYQQTGDSTIATAFTVFAEEVKTIAVTTDKAGLTMGSGTAPFHGATRLLGAELSAVVTALMVKFIN